MNGIGRLLRSLQWFIGRLSVLMGFLASSMVVVITVATLAEVFYRYLLGRSFLGVIELVEMLMAFIFFSLMSYTQYLKGHLRLTLFTDRMPNRVLLPLEVIVLLLVLVFISLMTWQAWVEAIIATQRQQIRFGAIEYPLWPAKLAAAVAMAVMSLQLLADFLERLIATVTGREPVTQLGRPAAESDSA
ncbi:MAG: TRAP transporter small permease [Gammaproteobacteria bacterium]|nr:TRAP transporter small permease [Gammaproteobacteria bacterium]